MSACFCISQEIHKKVMSLQFSECHTKIRHVDAHATLSDGVVVQVLGELSNNGQPMRKFMQTFVLAPEVSSFPLFPDIKLVADSYVTIINAKYKPSLEQLVD